MMTTQTTKSPQFANKAPQLVGKHPDTRHGVILYVEDVNLSFDGFRSHSRFLVQNHQYTIGFTRYFHRLFRKPRNCETLLEFPLLEES